MTIAEFDMQQLYANELLWERYWLALEALQRCYAAGAKEEDIETLCRETGVNIKDIINESKQSN